MTLKLIKDKKVVRLPSYSAKVESTIRRAEQSMRNAKWKKVIVVGIGEDGSRYIKNSGMNYSTAIGILEMAKHDLMRELNDD